MARWPDPIPAVVSHLQAGLGLPLGRVATKVRPDVDAVDASVRVARGPGSDDEVSDSFLVDVETFTLSARPADAWPLAEDARQAMHGLSGALVRGVQFDAVTTTMSPTVVDYGNPKVERYVASYRVDLRKT